MGDQNPDSRTNLLIAGVIIFALIGVSALGAITYMAISLPENEPTGRDSQPQPSTAPKQAAPADTAPAVKKETTAISNEALTKYSEAVEPLLVKTRTEMEGIVIDLKLFLKTVNQTKSSTDTKRAIDIFRDKLKEREQRLSELSSSLKAVAAPSELQKEHDRLSLGVVKYLVAVQSYIRGLSAYSFNQISSSQKDLEAADREIKGAADDFQKALAHLTVLSK